MNERTMSARGPGFPLPASRPRLIRTGSPYVGEQFKALAERWYTSEIIGAVAEQYRQGRRLFV
jgi:hypothetical protein